MAETEEAKKRDFRDGFLARDLADGAMALGQVEGKDVVLVRRGEEFLAVGANCAVSYKRGGCTLAVATISRNLQSLQAEASMEAQKS